MDGDGFQRNRAALVWADYFLNGNDIGETRGDRVLSEFWRLFEVRVQDQSEVDRVLDNYLKKRVRDMMHQAHVDSMKVYYYKMENQKIDDTLARTIEIEYEQHLSGQLNSCRDDVWPHLYRYWCSDGLKLKKKTRAGVSHYHKRVIN